MEQPQKFNMITLDLPNGEKLSAPVGIWLTGLLATLSEEQRTKVNETVGKMVEQVKNKPVLHIAKSGHHVMQAEGFNVGTRFGPRNGR